LTANIGEGNPPRLITKADLLEFVKDLLNIVKEESHKRMADAEKMAGRTRDQENLEWYFKGYKDRVNVFQEEFEDRIQRENGWKAPPSQSVSRDKNAYLSKSPIVGWKDHEPGKPGTSGFFWITTPDGLSP
jgi:hypothetical protein